jgi:molecular chaperone GrpE
MEASDEEEFIDEEEADMGPAALKKLREKLKKAIEEKQEYLDKWQRLQADFANFKRQEALIHVDREARIKSDIIESLIPALDTFEIALKHEADNKSLVMVYKQLLSSLKQVKVEQFGAAGEPFDPRKYEALREVPTDDAKKDHTVESVERSGYITEEKVIRPAQVSVFVHSK